LDVPVAVSQRMQAQFICYFCSIHCIWQILPTHNIIIPYRVGIKSGIIYFIYIWKSCLSPVLKQVHHHSKNIWEQCYHHEQPVLKTSLHKYFGNSTSYQQYASLALLCNSISQK
jgi:hypothetical protein